MLCCWSDSNLSFEVSVSPPLAWRTMKMFVRMFMCELNYNDRLFSFSLKHHTLLGRYFWLSFLLFFSLFCSKFTQYKMADEKWLLLICMQAVGCFKEREHHLKGGRFVLSKQKDLNWRHCSCCDSFYIDEKQFMSIFLVFQTSSHQTLQSIKGLTYHCVY